jgi:hypothetical protein
MSQQWTSWRTQRKTERLRTTAYWRRCPEARRTGWAWSPYRRSTTKDTRSEQVVSTTKQRLGRTKAHRQTVTSKDLISKRIKSITRQRQPKEELEILQKNQEPITNGPINGQTRKHWACHATESMKNSRTTNKISQQNHQRSDLWESTNSWLKLPRFGNQRTQNLLTNQWCLHKPKESLKRNTGANIPADFNLIML